MLKKTYNLLNNIHVNSVVSDITLITKENEKDYSFSNHTFYFVLKDTKAISNIPLTYIQVKNILKEDIGKIEIYACSENSTVTIKEEKEDSNTKIIRKGKKKK